MQIEYRTETILIDPEIGLDLYKKTPKSIKLSNPETNTVINQRSLTCITSNFTAYDPDPYPTNSRHRAESVLWIRIRIRIQHFQ
jgi:hypothetical protein